MGWLMEPIYTAISWILLQWHWVWDHILPNGQFLGTTWDWVLAIVFLVITIRIILFPIFVKQIRSQRAMQALQPKLKELQQKHKGDQQTLREEMMKLYQTEKVNPLMGCLPLVLQIPVFFGLFHVLKGLNPLQPLDPLVRAGYGWTDATWNSAVVAKLFTAPIAAHFSSSPADLASLHANGVTVKIVSAVLVIIMMVTTFMTSRQMILKTGWSQDPQQRMIQKLMLYGIPFSLLLSGWYFPIGVIIYWVTQNLFSLGQQFWVLHKYPPPVTEGSIPMKKQRTPVDEPGFLARFIQAKPAAPKTQARGGFVNPVQPARTGLFRRKPAEIEAAPEPRSLAPRPGAKPVRPASSTSPAASVDDRSEPVADDTASSGTGPGAARKAAATPKAQPAKAQPAKAQPAKAQPAKGQPAKATPTKAVPGKAVPARANGQASTAGSANGSSGGAMSNGSSGGGSGSSGSGGNGASANGGSAASGGAAKATAGARKGPAKKAAPRKGQSQRKGGAKR